MNVSLTLVVGVKIEGVSVVRDLNGTGILGTFKTLLQPTDLENPNTRRKLLNNLFSRRQRM
jgi:hypothetical protein